MVCDTSQTLWPIVGSTTSYFCLIAQPRLTRYYLVVLEYFQRTGTNQTNTASQMDSLRRDVAALAGDHEWTVLYPGEGKGIAGSKSAHSHTRPTIILFWISLSLRQILDHEAVEPPIMSGVLGQLTQVSACFWNMDKIDKTQFPFPYTQVRGSKLGNINSG